MSQIWKLRPQVTSSESEKPQFFPLAHQRQSRTKEVSINHTSRRFLLPRPLFFLLSD